MPLATGSDWPCCHCAWPGLAGVVVDSSFCIATMSHKTYQQFSFLTFSKSDARDLANTKFWESLFIAKEQPTKSV